jgi:hypothetical protein
LTQLQNWREGKLSDRLFVPLSSEPYAWFASGSKQWELRKYGRQYTEKHVYPGRRVELRRGYSDKSHSLWGTIDLIINASDLQNFFEQVPYEEVIPIASSQENAILQVSSILNIQPYQFQHLIGFRVIIEK